jgi:hypothetical protein
MKFQAWTDTEEAVDRDQLLADVTLYWLTGTAGSSPTSGPPSASSADHLAASSQRRA